MGGRRRVTIHQYHVCGAVLLLMYDEAKVVVMMVVVKVAGLDRS